MNFRNADPNPQGLERGRSYAAQDRGTTTASSTTDRAGTSAAVTVPGCKRSRSSHRYRTTSTAEFAASASAGARSSCLEAGTNASAAAAANVYVTWKRGLRWYSVKLDWSTEAPEGKTCNRTRNPVVASDTVILRSGGPTGVWREEEIDPDALYRAHFEGGRADAEVPELQGIGILTDGDQTQSVSAAEYAGFVLYKEDRRPRVSSADRMPHGG
jgi:Protein of unknown function (DUF3047)